MNIFVIYYYYAFLITSLLKLLSFNYTQNNTQNNRLYNRSSTYFTLQYKHLNTVQSSISLYSKLNDAEINVRFTCNDIEVETKWKMMKSERGKITLKIFLLEPLIVRYPNAIFWMEKNNIETRISRIKFSEILEFADIVRYRSFYNIK